VLDKEIRVVLDESRAESVGLIQGQLAHIIVASEVLPKIRTGRLASPERKENTSVQKKESRPGI